jgi:hypothetical protein
MVIVIFAALLPYSGFHDRFYAIFLRLSVSDWARLTADADPLFIAKVKLFIWLRFGMAAISAL